MGLIFSSLVSCKKNDVYRETDNKKESFETMTDSSDKMEEQTKSSNFKATEDSDAEYAKVNYSRVSVHDPSIVKDNGKYYLFGSHMAWAESDNLTEWTTFKNNINAQCSGLLGDIWEEYCKTSTNPNLSGNLWAPDVIYNQDMQKYCMYMSVNGDDWNSAIVLLTADNIEGPYEYVGPVVYSGFNTQTHDVQKTDVYQVLGDGADISRYQSINDTKINAIDPCVKYDDEGNLWMSFGSWFVGIYLLKLDNQTGLRDYTYTYTTEENKSDEYYGYKIAGGNAVSGEGSYILKVGDYYYLFMSYGGLTATGGYQIRVYRSEKIMGPYEDEKGNSPIYTKNTENLFSDIGIRLMGSYKLSGNAEIHVAQGHNSALLDEDGKIFLVYHTRFANGKNGNSEAHEVRIQQMFVNENNWLVLAPYEYSGETISDTGYDESEIVGEYEFVVHNPKTYYQIVGDKTIGILETKNIKLNKDKTVTGDVEGTWDYEKGTANMSIIVDDIEYKGIFLKQATENSKKIVTTFTALGDNICVWGSKK